jgi:hypothetical protein
MRHRPALLLFPVQAYVKKPFRVAQDSGVDENPELCTKVPKKRGLELIYHFWNVAFVLEWPRRNRSRSQSYRLSELVAEFLKNKGTMHCVYVESQKMCGKRSDAASVEVA